MAVQRCPECQSDDLKIDYMQVRQMRPDYPFRDIIRTSYTYYCCRCKKVTKRGYRDEEQPITDNAAYLY